MVGLAVTLGVVVAGSVLQFVGFGFFHNRVSALNSASDGGLFGVTGRVAIALAALASWIVLEGAWAVGRSAARLTSAMTIRRGRSVAVPVRS